MIISIIASMKFIITLTYISILKKIDSFLILEKINLFRNMQMKIYRLRLFKSNLLIVDIDSY